MKFKKLIPLLCLCFLSSCYTSQFASKFSDTQVELGMSQDDFIQKFGKPFNKEMSYTYDKHKRETLFYKEDFDAFGGYKMDFNGFGGDDIDYWLNYIDAAYPMIRIPEVLFFYRLKSQDESVWQNYSLAEFKFRQKHKNSLLLRYHPKMRFWSFVYKLTHSFWCRIFWRYKVKKNRKILRILGITVYKSDEISF